MELTAITAVSTAPSVARYFQDDLQYTVYQMATYYVQLYSTLTGFTKTDAISFLNGCSIYFDLYNTIHYNTIQFSFNASEPTDQVRKSEVVGHRCQVGFRGILGSFVNQAWLNDI